MKINLKPCRAEHVYRVCENLREVDWNEVYAATGRDPKSVIIEGWQKSSASWSIINGESPIAVAGVTPTLIDGIGSPWMVGTDDLAKFSSKMFLLRISKSVIANMLFLYPHLVNWVDCRNKPSMKFLDWCGFTFEKNAEPYGFLGLPFYRFYMKGCDNV